MNNRIIGALVLLVVVMCIGSIILALAEPTPFVINGEIFDADGNPCNDPGVNATNTNTSSGLDTETYPGSNYFQLVLVTGTDLNASEILRFEVTNSDGTQSKIEEHSVTEDEIGDGGLFDFTITLAPTTALIFDTGASANPYPSIFGTHNGTITPDVNITVNRMYTYPCAGTGGHTEYVRIWNESIYEEIEGEGYWSGYQGDYHNVTISPTITLVEGYEYNYTIRTGSYPQIIHAKSKSVTGGNITCTKFTDANGKEYDNWIPAIRLWREE